MERLVGSKWEGGLLKIDGPELKHLRALRLKKGDEVEVFCEDKLYLARISTISGDSALCSILEELDQPLPKPQVVLYQCLPIELRLMDEVVDRASQAGVAKLVPLFCKRGFNGKINLEEKLNRWKRVSLASFKQCKRPKPMEIEEPIKLTDLYPREEVSLVLDSFAGSLTIRDIDLSKDTYGLLVGPEGGLTREEVDLLKSRGFLTLFLRPYILRTEMAGAVASALIMNLAKG